MIIHRLAFLPLALPLTLLLGCASSSQVIVGHTHRALDPSLVRLYTDRSEIQGSFEVIAVLSSEATGGLTQQQNSDLAIDKLKQDAAKLGANGLLLEAAGHESPRAVVIPTASGPIVGVAGRRASNFSGKAIFVTAAQMADSRTAAVAFISDPSGADVYIDEVLVGRTPLSGQPVVLGHHRLQLVVAGYKTWQGEFDAKVGPTLTLEFTLLPASK